MLPNQENLFDAFREVGIDNIDSDTLIFLQRVIRMTRADADTAIDIAQQRALRRIGKLQELYKDLLEREAESSEPEVLGQAQILIEAFLREINQLSAQE